MTELETSTPASQAFAAAFENPDEFDFGMETEREETGFANFGVDPEKAEQLRNEELCRMANVQNPVLKMGTVLTISGHNFTVTKIEETKVIMSNGDQTIDLTHEEVYNALEQAEA